MLASSNRGPEPANRLGHLCAWKSVNVVLNLNHVQMLLFLLCHCYLCRSDAEMWFHRYSNHSHLRQLLVLIILRAWSHKVAHLEQLQQESITRHQQSREKLKYLCQERIECVQLGATTPPLKS